MHWRRWSPERRLEVALSGGLLQVTTGSLEHRIIREKLSALRSGEEEGITLEIKVKTLAAAGGGSGGCFSPGSLCRPPPILPG